MQKLSALNATNTKVINAHVNADDLVCVALYNFIQAMQNGKQYDGWLVYELNAAYDNDNSYNMQNADAAMGRNYARIALEYYENDETDSAFVYANMALLQRTLTLDLLA